MSPIIVAEQGPPTSAALEFLSKVNSTRDSLAADTPLLSAIKTVLRGTDADNPTAVHTARFFSGNDKKDHELSWNAQHVVLTYSGVMIKRWCFDHEGESIQWACLAEIEQVVVPNPVSTHSAANYAMSESTTPAATDTGSPTFGPFHRANVERARKDESYHQVLPCVFIFLRSIGKMYLMNGVDYTFSLPFIVRKAWPVSPHGVMMQRVLEPSEVVEAESNGEQVLPTIFTLTSPFSEAAAVGYTVGILRADKDSPATLKDEEEHSTKSLKSIPPTEMVVWVSHCSVMADARVVVTVDVKKKLLSIWHYVYIKPKGLAFTVNAREQPKPSEKAKGKQRQSFSGLGIGLGSRRTSAMFDGIAEGRQRVHPASPGSRMPDPPMIPPEFFELPDTLPLASLPGMPPSLSTNLTMSSLGGAAQKKTGSSQGKGRRNSLSRNELSTGMDRAVMGVRTEDSTFIAIDHGRMKASYWMECLLTHQIPGEDALAWRNIVVDLFDCRFDGKQYRCLISICLPTTKSLQIFSLAQLEDRSLQAIPLTEVSALSAVSVRATRENVWDLLVLKPHGELNLLLHGLRELPIQLRPPSQELPTTGTDMDVSTEGHNKHGMVVGLEEAYWGNVTLLYEDGWKSQVTFDLYPQDKLVTECFQLLALMLSGDITFEIRRLFLEKWCERAWSTVQDLEFTCFSSALLQTFGLGVEDVPVAKDPWAQLGRCSSHSRFAEDPVLRLLEQPPTIPVPRPTHNTPNPMLAPLLYGLQILAEHLRLSILRQQDLLKLAPLICRIAVVIRPEWADYWKRLVPDAISFWPSSLTTPPEFLDDRIAVWPPDLSAILYGRISTPDWKVPWHDIQHILSRFPLTPSFEYGVIDPLRELHELTLLYNTLSDGKVTECQKRAENTVLRMITKSHGRDITADLPLGIAAPLREAARTCQLSPPGHWPLEAYSTIGRNDLATSATQNQDVFVSRGYKTRKEFINSSKRREEISEIIFEARALAAETEMSMSGVDLNLKEFTDIRFGLDRRLEEVARMLCSSAITTVKGLDRELTNEHDQAKEHQNHAVRVAERTFALPYGRAMFTFGSVTVVNREAVSSPKIEYSFKIQPHNIFVTPEPGKISPESIAWGEFHNGVAAALRIAANASGVESSWIAFNKPGELSPEHAGFLLGLGLTGHLKALMTWHTFSYLTPKHDHTSIGLLLGMAAANVGTGNQHITKLLAVHTPALLPTQDVDLNIPLITQTAGVAGVGLLYLGTKNRRMAEVCLNQICRRDLVQPDLSNEHREAYTYASALAFGMIMLGKGTIIPVDLDLIKRLNILIHGSTNATLGRETKAFDINLTSPAASMALGLMYLRTGRKDVGDILSIPETIVELNSIQPSFLLIRTIARSLIMWDGIAPSNDWIASQIPQSIRDALASRQKTGNPIDDSMDLAYYNIIAGCCFVIGLKYAGTARQEAYQLIVKQFDSFSRTSYTPGPAFDHKIKRSAVRDGLNLISIALSMVMAGTGEITCLKRLRYAYGMSQQMMYLHGFKYGVHMSTHMALGLLFLGGGRYTLGTSDAAIAAMIMAFFPRFHHVSSDNRSYLQALRHMWVLAVEPRCLIARDVDTNEVVYLPVKITVNESDTTEQTQLISPTLIPDIDKLMSIRVDTPRYWPFYLDIAAHPQHKEALLRSQTLYVKRRTAFLSYTEDPRGSRSLFVRSGSSAGGAAALDFPQLTDVKTHPAGDLGEFITSFSNNVLFLAFADHFSRQEGETEDEIIFQKYCHATLLDSILQDKPQTLQYHLTLYMYRNMSPKSRYFNLRLQDLRFAAEFYAKVYDRRFSGRTEDNPRPALIRDTTVQGALHALDQKLESIRCLSAFLAYMGQYVKGGLSQDERALAPVSDSDDSQIQDGEMMSRYLCWYLLRNGVPVSTLLVVLRQLANDAHKQCLGVPSPEGTSNPQGLDVGIKEVLHATGTRMTTSLGSGWNVRSLNEIIETWSMS